MSEPSIALDLAQIGHPPPSIKCFDTKAVQAPPRFLCCQCDCQARLSNSFAESSFPEEAEFVLVDEERPNGPDRGIFEDLWKKMVEWLASPVSKAADDLDGQSQGR